VRGDRDAHHPRRSAGGKQKPLVLIAAEPAEYHVVPVRRIIPDHGQNRTPSDALALHTLAAQAVIERVMGALDGAVNRKVGGVASRIESVPDLLNVAFG